MKKVAGVIFLTWVTAASSQEPSGRIWSGTLSDSMCGASHQMKTAAGGLSDRECVFECVKELAKYVLVDDKQQVIPITTQDLGGLPLYAGRLVRITGELKDGAIVATKVEAIPAHLHLGHVMTNWRDTPANVGFLIAAISDARVAVTHAELAVRSVANLDEMKLHAGHVLNALDPSIEPKGPGSGYGVKKASTGALQHLEFAMTGEGASPNVKASATRVLALLKDVLSSTEEAIAIAQKIAISNAASEGGVLAADLVKMTRQISQNNLQEAKAQMDALMKAEGLENTPR